MSTLEAEFARAMSADSILSVALGDPVRLVAGETAKAAYPYIRIERHEIRRASAETGGPQEHRLSLELLTRSGGRQATSSLLTRMTETLRSIERSLDGVQVVLIHPVFSDVFLTRDGITHRGLLRLKVVLEAV